MIEKITAIVQELYSEYEEGFIYVDLTQLEYTPNTLCGKFMFTGSAYLKTYSKILNNTEAMFIFNQLQYYLLSHILFDKGILGVMDTPDSINTMLDGIVYRDMHFNFNKMITENDTLYFTSSAEHYVDRKNRNCFKVHLDLISGAFTIDGTAVCLNSRVHSEGI